MRRSFYNSCSVFNTTTVRARAGFIESCRRTSRSSRPLFRDSEVMKCSIGIAPPSSSFELSASGPGPAPLSWVELPASLAEYLSQALQIVSGAPEEAMPGFKHPAKPERNYFAKVFYEGDPATDETGGGPLVLLLFPGFDQLARQFAGRGRPEKAGDDRRTGQRRRARLQQPDHGHPVQRRGDAGAAQPGPAGPRQPGQHHPRLLHRRLAHAQPARLRQAAAADDGALQPGRPDPRRRADRRRRLREISHRAGQGFPGPESADHGGRLLFEPEPLPAQPDQERPRSHARRRHDPRALGRQRDHGRR